MRPSVFLLALFAGIAVTVGDGLYGSGRPPTRISSSAGSPLVILDGIAVPDIGPLPSSVPGAVNDERSSAKIALGKQLYFDGRLSRNDRVSCAYCHIPGSGFADPHPTSAGVDDLVGGRQAPTILNAAFNPWQFWDGRARSLEEQALGPIQNPIEMAETAEHLSAKLQRITGYQRQFQEVFGAEVSLPRIAEAIAAFERTLISKNSAFDRYLAGDAKAMDEAAIRGLELFKGKARCILCHNGPNFTDNQFHNLGVPQVGRQQEDLGRYYVTGEERDKGAFKTPTLRSVLETAPYMHDGVFLTLEEVVDFLDQGGGPNPHLSPLMQPLGLTAEEKAELVAFLEALTGEPLKIEMPVLP
ncbi:cytochrome-c peroxidase [Candidatus Nitrospira bockiana]